VRTGTETVIRVRGKTSTQDPKVFFYHVITVTDLKAIEKGNSNLLAVKAAVVLGYRNYMLPMPVLC
jgi:hypothetical protein